MSIFIEIPTDNQSSKELTFFMSGSIPDPVRWKGAFEPLEITDAIVSFARTCLIQGHKIVTAAHPTLAPLLLYVAAELPRQEQVSIRIYQSLLFEDILPTATRRFEAEGIGEIIWTEAAAGEEPVPGKWDESLRIMRLQMLHDTKPDAAVFVGGMEGINQEFNLFRREFPNRPTYALGHPGGEAANLDTRHTGELRQSLAQGNLYPVLWQAVVDHAMNTTANDSQQF